MREKLESNYKISEISDTYSSVKEGKLVRKVSEPHFIWLLKQQMRLFQLVGRVVQVCGSVDGSEF